MAFNLDATLDPEIYSKAISNGIENWKVVWNYRVNNANDDTFDVPLAENVAGTIRSSMLTRGQGLGFWRHAAEYWLLARVMFLRKTVSDQKDQNWTHEPLDTSVNLTWAVGPSPFDRYDQNA